MEKIETFERLFCPVCGAKGLKNYVGTVDYMFGTPGNWNFYKCSNRECLLLWLNPTPLKEELYKLYVDYYTHYVNDGNHQQNILKNLKIRIQRDFFASNYGYFSGNKSFLGFLLYFWPVKLEESRFKVMYLHHKNGKLLDIGCGSGDFLFFMRELGWDTIGIDFDMKAIDVAKKRDLNVNFGTVFDQKYPENTFDAITLSHVIEHLLDPIETINECLRILKQSGKIVIVTPNSKSLGHKIFKKNWRGLEPPRHINIFSPQSLETIFKQNKINKYKIETSLRAAEFMYTFSKQIELKGCLQENKFNLIRKLFLICEWFLMVLRFNVGEELIVTIEK